MKATAASRKYSSPLRQSHTQDTRERILQATAELLEASPHGDISMDEVARGAGVERRTVFRHFASKEALFDAFWTYINAKMDTRPLPRSLDELVAAPTETFVRFDAHEGVMRASLHTQSGHAMRMRSVPARREAFHACLEGALAKADADAATRTEALFHLLYSAGAWEILRDYCGMDGKQAGETVSWAMNTLLAAMEGTGGGNADK